MLVYEQHPGVADYGLPPVVPHNPPSGGRSRSEIEMGKVFIGGLARETRPRGCAGTLSALATSATASS